MGDITKKNMESDNKVLIKRNNQAPGFTSSLAGNRSQMLIERYIQYNCINVQEYIKTNRILTMVIPIDILRKWYPGPNWKKDIAKVCFGKMRDIKQETMPNGNFKMMTLFAYAELTDEGLFLDVVPKVLQNYIVGNGNPYTSLEYNLTTKFESKFCHEIYWEICKHDNPREKYKFFLTPNEINEKFATKYNVTNILEKILKPTQEEIKRLYEQNFSPRFFTFEERREVVGKCKKITGWEFTVYNQERNRRQDIKAQEAYLKIDKFLEEKLDKYRINILSQIKNFNSEKIILIWMRLENYMSQDVTTIRNEVAYLCSILSKYGINPHSSTKGKTEYSDMPLFEKEEKDTSYGIRCWLQCSNHIAESSTASNDVKKLFEQVHFYSYASSDEGNKLILSVDNEEVHRNIKTYLLSNLQELLSKYFPQPLTFNFHVNQYYSTTETL